MNEQKQFKEIKFDESTPVHKPRLKKPEAIKRAASIISQRQSLPVYDAREPFLHEFRNNASLVLVGETGCGKTTQIPQFIYEAGAYLYPNAPIAAPGSPWHSRTPRIAITQPRRVAAVSLARRVNEEIYSTQIHQFQLDDEELGVEKESTSSSSKQKKIHKPFPQPKTVVGHRVRFEDSTNASTAIKYLTDGMLLREAMLDARLQEYSTVILDEAHERTLHTDLLFAIVRQAQAARASSRRPLKVVVMSATLDAQRFAEYFAAKIVYVEGRLFPVQVMYTPEPEPDYLDAAYITAVQIHTKEPPGDILVFLPGQEDIESVANLLETRQKQLEKRNLLLKDDDDNDDDEKNNKNQYQSYRICCMYSALPPEKQMKAFDPAPPGVRKIILATNIAETSITINGIRYVVDCGLVKSKSYNPKTGLEALLVAPISKAAARQRAGRAGREREGVCYRLFTESSFDSLAAQTQPEIKRCLLDHLVLQLQALGVRDVLNFPYMDAPPLASLSKAMERLLLLGALDPATGGLTRPMGENMARLPLAPMYGKTLLCAQGLHCAREVLTIVAMLSVDTVFHNPLNRRAEADEAKRRFSSKSGGDHVTLLHVFEGYLAEPVERRRAYCRANFLNERSLAKAVEVRMQLKEYCAQVGVDPEESCWQGGDPEKDSEPIRRAFLSGFFLHTAMKDPSGACYRTVIENKIVHIHPSSVLFSLKPNCVVYCELMTTTKHYMHDVIPVSEAWIQEIMPKYQKKLE